MRGETKKGDEYNSYCPVCQPTGESKDKRLYWKYDGDKLLVQCKHGCKFEDIVKYFPKKNKNQNKQWVKLREHIYYTETGAIFGKKVYYSINGEKSPVWQRYENGKYESGLNGQKAGLYNITELMLNQHDDVFIVEGEKDVDTLKKNGILAVSPPNGAGFWKPLYNQYFRKRNVIIVPDNDEPGRKHLEIIAKNLKKIAKTVRLLDLTNIVPDLKKGGDVSDVFDELPNAKDLLFQLVTETDSEDTRLTDICFITDNNNKPLKTFDNFKILLEHYCLSVKNNSISGIEFKGKLPKMTEDNKETITMTYLYSISKETKINFNKDEILNYTTMEADINSYNPVIDWLEKLNRTEKGYIREYFNCLCFEEEEKQNIEIYLKLFGKWLIQCIAMQFNTIEKPYGADGVLGLQCQNEGIGKTTFFKNLCFDSTYFKDSVILDPTNKDSVRKATAYWICELGEVESTLSKDLARLKAFITEDYDTYRIQFATGFTTKPRRTSYCFTCNTRNFLKDGDNRRFWTIPIIDVDIEKLKTIDIRKVWGEAYALYLYKPQGFRLSKKELEFLIENNREKFGFKLNEEEVLRDKLNFTLEDSKWEYWTASDLSLYLFDNRRHARIIGKVLTEKLGYKKKVSCNDNRHYKIIRGIKKYFVPIKNIYEVNNTPC